MITFISTTNNNSTSLYNHDYNYDNSSTRALSSHFLCLSITSLFPLRAALVTYYITHPPTHARMTSACFLFSPFSPFCYRYRYRCCCRCPNIIRTVHTVQIVQYNPQSKLSRHSYTFTSRISRLTPDDNSMGVLPVHGNVTVEQPRDSALHQNFVPSTFVRVWLL